MHLIYDLFVLLYEALIYLSITLQCGCDQSLSLLLLAVTIITQISSSCDDPLSLREIHYQHLIRYPVTGQWFYENGNIISTDSVFLILMINHWIKYVSFLEKPT